MIVLIAALFLVQERADTPEACMKCHTEQANELKGSVHARETCISCHGTDEVVKNPRGTVSHRHLPTLKSWRGRNLVEDCAACHTGIYDAYRVSGHTIDTKKPLGEMKKGCLDCHAGDDPELTPGGRAHGIPKASRGAILNSCRGCHQTSSADYVSGRQLYQDQDVLDGRISAIEVAMRGRGSKPGVSVREVTAALAGAKRTAAELQIRQHGLQFKSLEELRASAAGPLEASYYSQSKKEKEFEGRWKYAVPFLMFVGASIVFVQLRARKGTT